MVVLLELMEKEEEIGTAAVGSGALGDIDVCVAALAKSIRVEEMAVQ